MHLFCSSSCGVSFASSSLVVVHYPIRSVIASLLLASPSAAYMAVRSLEDQQRSFRPSMDDQL